MRITILVFFLLQITLGYSQATIEIDSTLTVDTTNVSDSAQHDTLIIKSANFNGSTELLKKLEYLKAKYPENFTSDEFDTSDVMLSEPSDSVSPMVVDFVLPIDIGMIDFYSNKRKYFNSANNQLESFYYHKLDVPYNFISVGLANGGFILSEPSDSITPVIADSILWRDIGMIDFYTNKKKYFNGSNNKLAHFYYHKLGVPYYFIPVGLATGGLPLYGSRIRRTNYKGSLLLKRVYQGETFYVLNPIVNTKSSSMGCVKELVINNVVLDRSIIQATVFEIDLESMDVEIGDKIDILLVHMEGCIPKILNPKTVTRKRFIKPWNLKMNKDGLLTWSGNPGHNNGTYIIQQFLWSNWIDRDSICALEYRDSLSYSYKHKPQGFKNKIRIRFESIINKEEYSEIIEYNSIVVPVELTREKRNRKYNKNSIIDFSDSTRFELYGKYGFVKKHGYANHFNLSELEFGDYYLNYDTKMFEFQLVYRSKYYLYGSDFYNGAYRAITKIIHLIKH